MAVSTRDSAGDARDRQGNALKRAISGKLLFLFILGDVLGAGIYALVGEMAQQAGDLLDSFVITGRSLSRRRPDGTGELVRLNLLSQRLQVERELPRAAEGGNQAARPAVYEALREAKRELQNRGVLQRALDAVLT